MSYRAREGDAQGLAGMGPTRAFRAPSIRDALDRVKSMIGVDAVILATRDLGRDGGAGVPEAERYEVVAAWPASAQIERAAPSTVRAREGTTGTAAETRVPEPGGEAGEIAAREAVLTRQLARLEQAVRGLESQIQQLALKDRRMRDEIGRLERERALLEEGGPTAALMAAGVEREVASELVERAVRRATPRQGLAVAKSPDLADEIERTVRAAPPLWSLPAGSVAALVGPSGAGKTTTLLKIAGLATFARRREVAIVSTDLDRLGAFEMLETYAEVMGVPVVAARERGDVERALERFADKDLVLIDTAGHNPFDAEQRHRALKPASGREVRHHLVLPATLSPTLVGDTIAAYDGPALESLIVTRLDEARGPTAVLAACLRADLPVSHFATGRDIPDDIRAVDAREVAQTLLRRAS